MHGILALSEGDCKRPRDRPLDTRTGVAGQSRDAEGPNRLLHRRKPSRDKPSAPRGDGIVRVRRETGGRGGKTVTAVYGVALADDELRPLAGELKRLCGTGGTVKDGAIEIQGDHRERIVAALEKRGYIVKLAGG